MGEVQEVTDEEAERLCTELFGFSDPIVVYEWSDRKRRERPAKAYRAGKDAEAVSGRGFFGIYVGEDGQRQSLREMVGRRALPDLRSGVGRAWSAVEALERHGWHLELVRLHRPWRPAGTAPGVGTDQNGSPVPEGAGDPESPAEDGWRAVFIREDDDPRGYRRAPAPFEASLFHFARPQDAILRAALCVLDVPDWRLP